MELAEQTSSETLSRHKPDTNISAFIRLSILNGILKGQIEIAQKLSDNIARLDKIKDAIANLSMAEFELASDPGPQGRELFLKTGNLHAEETVVTNRLEQVRIAKARYDLLIYPPGMSSEIAAQNAPKFRLSDGQIISD